MYKKLQTSCKNWKKDLLTKKYPDLCSTIEEVKGTKVTCQLETNNYSGLLNGSLLKLRDELYVYARDNVAVVNVYIKDATVTKIQRDQQVTRLGTYINVLMSNHLSL